MELYGIAEAINNEAKAAKALSDIMWLMTSISENSDLRVADIYEGVKFIMDTLDAHINNLSQFSAEILRIKNNSPKCKAERT